MKISCVPCYDMRSFNSVEAVRQIKKISCVALVILPKTDDPELNAAFADIPMDCVASVIRLDKDTPVTTINGEIVLSDANTVDNQFFVLNGNAKILPLSPDKHIKIIVNGNITTDINNRDNIEYVQANGKIEERDFANMIELPPNSLLNAVRFQNKKAYYNVPNIAIIEEVPSSATGMVESDIVIAHDSVARSSIKIEARHIAYVPEIEKYTFINKTPTLKITKDFLQNIGGKLVVFQVAKVNISRDVTPELLNEKLLVICMCASVTAKRKLKSMLSLKCAKCAQIKVKL